MKKWTTNVPNVDSNSKMTNKFNYEWNIADGYPGTNIKKNNLRVFSCFACGGGSSMGYKLAGFSVVGINEIDKKMVEIYQKNHKIQHIFHEPIQEFKNRESFPEELFDLDILDGSPPCSTFSLCGSREDAWGKEKKFREGQAKQVLSDLFFDYLDLVERLKPKVVIAENVRGMIAGNAKGYVVEVNKRFKELGYDVQLFLLNAASMGVPQKRERVFFIARRKDLGFPKLNLKFDEKVIPFKEISEGIIENPKEIANCDIKYYDKVKPGQDIGKVHPKGNRFNSYKLSLESPVNTIASGSDLYHPHQRRYLTDRELKLAGSWPQDYDFLGTKPQYVIGMSVPPVMVAQIAHQIYLQWFLSEKKY